MRSIDVIFAIISKSDTMYRNIKVVGFDADDTLWVNEPNYNETERRFISLLKNRMNPDLLPKELYATEMNNLHLYGYGAKSFTLSMIETAVRICGESISGNLIEKIIALGKALMDKPIELLEGVEAVLKKLNGNYRLIIATKGDLLDQERKLKKSGIAGHFHHIEIMSEKNEAQYQNLLKHLDIKPDEFIMIGNSMRSDILPVLEIGSYAIHVPYHTNWEHELTGEPTPQTNRLLSVSAISEVTGIL